MMDINKRPHFFTTHNGEKAPLPFSDTEYENRLAKLRGIMAAHPEATIVVVSALDQSEILKSAFKLGASDFVVKPFDKKNLIETLSTLVPTASCC